jgi:hypothetical protein
VKLDATKAQPDEPLKGRWSVSDAMTSATLQNSRFGSLSRSNVHGTRLRSI